MTSFNWYSKIMSRTGGAISSKSDNVFEVKSTCSFKRLSLSRDRCNFESLLEMFSFDSLQDFINFPNPVVRLDFKAACYILALSLIFAINSFAIIMFLTPLYNLLLLGISCSIIVFCFVNGLLNIFINWGYIKFERSFENNEFILLLSAGYYF